MGSSYIEYRGRGFWSFDPFIERLVGEVADDIGKKATKEHWETELAAHWKLQASGVFSGWVHLKLDEFLMGDERRAQLRYSVERVTDERAAGDPIHETGILLLQLLDGKLVTAAGSPLDYMVGRADEPQGDV